MTRALALAIATLAAFVPPALAAARVQEMVVFRDGHAKLANPSTAQASVKVRGRSCTLASATPLAALVRSGIGPLSLRDYGSCSKNPNDGSSLFVSAIGSDRNRGSDGWVYKAGNRLGTAGAADPAGPLGNGRLRAGAHVTWFWCHVTQRDGGCPHTLVVSAQPESGAVLVRVRQYNDAGKGAAARGATVHAGSASGVTGSDGSVKIGLPAGRVSVWAEQSGRVRSFPVTVSVT